MVVADEQARTAASLKEDVENKVIRKEEDESLASAVIELRIFIRGNFPLLL